MSFWQAGISSKVTRDPIRPNEKGDDDEEIRGRGNEEQERCEEMDEETMEEGEEKEKSVEDRERGEFRRERRRRL